MNKLKKELEILDKRRQELQQQIKEEISINALPGFKKLIGRYFKFRNAYSREQEWFEYLQVTGVRDDSIGLSYYDEPVCEVRGIVFSKDSDGKISFNMNGAMYAHSIGEEITETEFKFVYEELIKEISIKYENN